MFFFPTEKFLLVFFVSSWWVKWQEWCLQSFVRLSLFLGKLLQLDLDLDLTTKAEWTLPYCGGFLVGDKTDFFVHSKVVVDSVSLSSWLHMWARMCKVVIPIQFYLWHGSFAGQRWHRWLPHLGSTYSQVSIPPSPHFFTHWLHISGSSSMWSVARCAWIISLESLCATSTRISPASPATIWKKWPQRGTGPCQRWVHPLFNKRKQDLHHWLLEWGLWAGLQKLQAAFLKLPSWKNNLWTW